MDDKIKKLRLEIEHYESEVDSVSRSKHLSYLYGKMKENGYYWNNKIKSWEFEQEDGIE